jgi:hypothetical protein
MRSIYIGILCSFIILVAACSKDDDRAALPENSISFQLAAGKDTVEMPVSILKDTTLVLKLQAALSGTPSSTEHYIGFGVDTTKILAFRARYGSSALLLPATSYLFYRSMVRIAAGGSVSDSAVLNIGQQTKLKEYSTYVLPLVIQSVDGNTDGTATSRVVYFVFKTGKPLFVNKTGWTIAGFSSANGTLAATNVLDDNNLTTYWASNIQQNMPQWFSINFNKDIVFTAVNYYLPTALKYPTLGGYPTSMKIETSMDGTNWVDKGIFAGNIVNNAQTLDIGETTARYLRFTSLAVVKYNADYEAVFISGISLIP